MADEADRLAASDPDYAIRDLFNAIAEKKFPSWTMHIQVTNTELLFGIIYLLCLAAAIMCLEFL